MSTVRAKREANDKGEKENQMTDEVAGSSTEVISGSTGSQEAPNNNVQDGVAPGNTAEGAEGAANAAPQGETQDEFVKGDDGEEYISRKAFDARIGKLTQQKHEARQQVLEALRTDPQFKQEFMESLNIGEESANSPEGTNEPTPFEQFLAPLPQEHQAHYRNMMTSVAQEFESFVNQRLDEAMKPIMSWIGQEKVKTFAQTNKDFGQYQRDVEKIMSTGRAKSLEDAYVLASHEAKLKAANNVGAREESDRRQKLSRAPITGKGNAGGISTQGNKKVGLHEALQRAGQELGYTG